MTTFSFKSVGKTTTTRDEEETTVTETPIGIKTPMRLGTDDGILVMNNELIDQVKDNFKNLVLTNWGERLGLYKFGANLRPILVDRATNDNFDGDAMERISSATKKWMPYINLEEFTSSVKRADGGTAAVTLRITYNVPTLSRDTQALEVTLYTI